VQPVASGRKALIRNSGCEAQVATVLRPAAPILKGTGSADRANGTGMCSFLPGAALALGEEVRSSQTKIYFLKHKTRGQEDREANCDHVPVGVLQCVVNERIEHEH